MKRKIAALFSAFVCLIGTLGVTAYAQDNSDEDSIEWSATETTTAESTEDTTVSNSNEDENKISLEELEEILANNSLLQGQIDEIRRLFEENGISIDDLIGNVDGISGEIDDLQLSLADLYSLIAALQIQLENMQNSALSAPVQQNSDNAVPVNDSAVNGGSAGGGSGGFSVGGSITPDVIPTAQTATLPVMENDTETTNVTTVSANTEANGYLVEKANKKPDERDFITVSSRDGHVFYIVIDYENENKNVYFLNAVDTMDLQYLTEGSTANTVAVPVDVKTETTVPVEPDEAEEPTEQPSKDSGSNLMLYIGIGIIAIIIVFMAKKKLSGGKNKFDDDDEGDKDFTEEEPEIYVDEDKEEF